MSKIQVHYGLGLQQGKTPWWIGWWGSSWRNVTGSAQGQMKPKMRMSLTLNWPDFLNVTVSPLCDGEKFSWPCATFWNFNVQAGKFMVSFICLYSFCLFLPTLWPSLEFVLPFSCAKISKVKCWRRKKIHF